jgi:hypothetical protein
MPRFSKPTILGTVPYLASPTAIFGSSCHREHVQSTKSSKGVLSILWGALQLPALFDFYELVVYYVYLLASLLQSNARLSGWADQLGLCLLPNHHTIN